MAALADEALTSSLQTQHALINHAELGITAAAVSNKTGQLLITDGRFLRMYAGEKAIQATLPSTVR